MRVRVVALVFLISLYFISFSTAISSSSTVRFAFDPNGTLKSENSSLEVSDFENGWNFWNIFSKFLSIFLVGLVIYMLHKLKTKSKVVKNSKLKSKQISKKKVTKKKK